MFKVGDLIFNNHPNSCHLGKHGTVLKVNNNNKKSGDFINVEWKSVEYLSGYAFEDAKFFIVIKEPNDILKELL